MHMTGKYVDAFVVPVPKSRIEAYKQVAEAAGRVWKEHGALDYVECVADDVKPGKWIFFPDFLMGKALDDLDDFRLDPRYMLVESVRYTAPYGLSLSGGKISTFSQILAQKGLGI